MMRCILLCSLFFTLFSCQPPTNNAKSQPFYTDVPFVQDYAVKYEYKGSNPLQDLATDRNGNVQILGAGLLQTSGGQLLYPGEIIPYTGYRYLADRNIRAVATVDGQIVYADDKSVFSNAWAGHLEVKHSLPKITELAGNKAFQFLLTDGNAVQFISNNQQAWTKNEPGVINIVYSDDHGFFALTPTDVFQFKSSEPGLKSLFTGTGLSAIAVNKDHIAVGSQNGYILLDAATGKPTGDWQQKLPWNEITSIASINNNWWFGSTRGAFMLKEDGKYNYYASKRWLVDDGVKTIAPKDDSTVLVLSQTGLSAICFTEITLAEKAAFYDKQVRERHIRHGFNASRVGLVNHNPVTGYMEDSDNDGLWTSMYLAGEAYRYAVTKSPEALQNCKESLDAMERLFSANPSKGFPARSFEVKGYPLHDQKAWVDTDREGWVWKSTTSSDEAIGHVFVYGVIAELVDDAAVKSQAVRLLDSLMQHIVDNDFYMIDYDGKPTLWAKWNPEYVNKLPEMVGDRKINSSNIIAMLQTAYHFTNKEIYKEKAFELMDKHGYLENLMRPMKEIAMAPADADDWSKMLSSAWNHSDDEMYFLGYWGLYRYAFNDTLKAKFKASILDHWEIERPEKDGAWNIFTALTGVQEFDLNEAIWYLQEYPLDLIHWDVKNSDRLDIEKLEPNFRKQYTQEVLPPDELDISRHNANRFDLDGGRGGTMELSAGDIWLLPYWLGRYLEVIQ